MFLLGLALIINTFIEIHSIFKYIHLKYVEKIISPWPSMYAIINIIIETLLTPNSFA